MVTNINIENVYTIYLAYNRPICRTVTDAVEVLDVIVGFDRDDFAAVTFHMVDTGNFLMLMDSEIKEWEFQRTCLVPMISKLTNNILTP